MQTGWAGTDTAWWSAGDVAEDEWWHCEVRYKDRHQVFRQGLLSCLDGFDGIGRVEVVGTIADAWAHPALGEADVVLLDAMLDGAVDFVQRVLQRLPTGARRGSSAPSASAPVIASGSVPPLNAFTTPPHPQHLATGL